MITNGTESLGNAIRIFSLDEKKQDNIRHEYQAKIGFPGADKTKVL